MEQAGTRAIDGRGREFSPAPAKTNLRRVTAIGLILVVVALAVGLTTWNRDSGTNDQGLVFTIPLGASKTNSQPGIISAVQIPTTIVFKKGDNAAITIINNDIVDERAGPFLVGAGQTYVQRFPKPGKYAINCSVNAAESITVTVEG